MGRKYVANAFHNRSLIDSNKGGGGGGGGAAEEYVAEETKIGTFLGKDLYRQVISIASISVGTLTTIANIGSVVTAVTRLEGSYESNGFIDTLIGPSHANPDPPPPPPYAPSIARQMQVTKSSGAIRLWTNLGGSSTITLNNVIVIVEYTKD